MNYKDEYLKIINRLRTEMRNDLYKKKEYTFVDDRLTFLNNNYWIIMLLKQQVEEDNNLWTIEDYYGRINQLEDDISNNNKNNNYLIDKYICIVKRPL